MNTSRIRQFFHHPVVSILLSSTMILIVVLVLRPPDALVFKPGVDNAIRVMFGFLFFGFLFLLIGQNRLLFLSFACAAVICAFLKNRTESNTIREALGFEASPSFSLLHFNVSNITGDPEEAMECLLKREPDVLSIQEMNPSWNEWLQERLEKEYPYRYSLPDIDLSGFALYSKLPFDQLDTFEYQDLPILYGTLKLEDGFEVDLMGIHTYPALSQTAYEKIIAYLDLATKVGQQRQNPLLAFGHFRMVPWSNEILVFRQQLGLKDSRMGMPTAYPKGTLSLFNIPFDHIFYSDGLECRDFASISSSESVHLGILGMYQFYKTE
ncbi:MAG: endonuclease/exonuclease/phosphatase family protein [Bacteroidetes bacterium]|nr:endonuclease/exonuclease/phosphatase family protein [Bacteroidota bacterium]